MDEQKIEEAKTEEGLSPVPQKPKSKRFLAIYMIVLLVAALILLLLSYLANARTNDQLDSLGEEYTSFSLTASGSINALEEENERLKEQLVKQEADNERIRNARDNIIEMYTEKSREFNAIQETYINQKSLVTSLSEQVENYYIMYEIVRRVESGNKEDMKAATYDANHYQARLLGFSTGLDNGKPDKYVTEQLYPALDTLEKRGYITIEKDDDGNYISVSLTD